MDILIDWDQTREMPFIFPWKFRKEKKQKKPLHSTSVTTSITI